VQHTWPLAVIALAIGGGTTFISERVSNNEQRITKVIQERDLERENRHTQDIETARELAALRVELRMMGRVQVDTLNEVRILNGKPATTFKEAMDRADADDHGDADGP
jgi:hypothetical protein